MKQVAEASMIETDEYKTVCPYCDMKAELCIAALAASMIDKQKCFSGSYDTCAIFSINKRNREPATNAEKTQKVIGHTSK